MNCPSCKSSSVHAGQMGSCKCNACGYIKDAEAPIDHRTRVLSEAEVAAIKVRPAQQAHSRSEYRRLEAQGVSVQAPDSPAPTQEDIDLATVQAMREVMIEGGELRKPAQAGVRGRYLIKGREVLFDPELKPFLDVYSWSVRENKGNWYCETFMVIGGKQTTVTMHRLITGMRKLTVDHINGDGLDNRRENLRLCTVTENNRNCRGRSNKPSLYKGVHHRRGKWSAQIRVDGKEIHLGTYETEIEAARAYDKASEQYHGIYGRRNFPT